MKRKKIKKHNFNYFILIGLFTLSTLILITNDFGLLKYFKLSQKHAKLTSELNSLLKQQSALRNELQQLETDEDYIRKIAREKFMMVLPGEKVYRVKNEKQ